ncbi:MAG: hypothetical protein JWM42_2241 [Burkholderia sp.]|nr:hypothetical protein [Burkholderia sp.]
MFQKKKIVVPLAAAMLVAACGGGGGDTNGDTTATGSLGTPSITSPSDTPPANQTPNQNVSNDQQLKGHLSIVANQLVYLKPSRTRPYWANTVDAFESDRGLFDIASGSKDGDANAEVPAPAAAPAAPLASFGFRVGNFVLSSTAGEAVGNQTAVGRIAFDFTERPASPGIASGEAAESMKFVIDGVELKTDANGRLASARVIDGAQMHVYGRTATGVEVRESVAASTGSVRLLPIREVLDAYGDDSSVVLLADLEAAFAQAGPKLAAFENMRGHFSMKVTMSTAKLERPAASNSEEGPLARRDLVGPSITVNSQPAVVGAGLSGNVWIRDYPANTN